MKGCQALILAQAAADAEQAQTNAEQSEKIAALESEMEKLRKLLAISSTASRAKRRFSSHIRPGSFTVAKSFKPLEPRRRLKLK